MSWDEKVNCTYGLVDVGDVDVENLPRSMVRSVVKDGAKEERVERRQSAGRGPALRDQLERSEVDLVLCADARGVGPSLAGQGRETDVFDRLGGMMQTSEELIDCITVPSRRLCQCLYTAREDTEGILPCSRTIRA